MNLPVRERILHRGEGTKNQLGLLVGALSLWEGRLFALQRGILVADGERDLKSVSFCVQILNVQVEAICAE